MAVEGPVLLLIGTRPEAIKLAPVVLALRATGIEHIVISTGQHRDLLEPVIECFGLTIADDLAVMRPDQTLAGLTSLLLERIDDCLAAFKPSLVVVQGDTTTAFAGTLAAFYRRIPVAHVEAGLRTGRLDSPFPEEANRVLVGRLARLHFAPTALAGQRLLEEGVPADRIEVTGNTVIDALRIELARQDRDPAARIAAEAGLTAALGSTWRQGGPIVLITAHRRESFGDGLLDICQAITELATQFGDHRFVFPVHPNPQVRNPVRAALSALPNVTLLDPVPYPTLVALLSACHLVLTDSGGLQEEAPGLAKPVLVMRETTERVEGVQAGVVQLVGIQRSAIVRETARLLQDPNAYAAMAGAVNPYGDGFAAARIGARIQSYRSNCTS